MEIEICNLIDEGVSVLKNRLASHSIWMAQMERVEQTFPIHCAQIQQHLTITKSQRLIKNFLSTKLYLWMK